MSACQPEQSLPRIKKFNGVGKTTLARNLAHQALIHGHTMLFTSAGQLLGESAAWTAILEKGNDQRRRD
jgi:hypothetical protein